MALQVFRIYYIAFSSVVSFDGGVYLQVAQALANGNGYCWDYAPQPHFPAEVTTGWPVIFPASLIFKFAGVNLITAQLCNVLYFLVLLLIIFQIIRFVGQSEAHNTQYTVLMWGSLACILFCSFPLVEEFALNGYGEIPSLFWFLLSCYFLFIRNEEHEDVKNFILGGIFAGLSISTKTVMFLGCMGLVGTLFVSASLNRKNLAILLRKKLPLFMVGLFLPFFFFEIFRFCSFGSVSGYLDFLRREYTFIASETKITDAVGMSVYSRVCSHFTVMAAGLGFSRIFWHCFYLLNY